jgi:energy-converting hydrogenase Eha subunit F
VGGEVGRIWEELEEGRSMVRIYCVKLFSIKKGKNPK